MTDRDYQIMDDNELEAVLRDHLDELPPDDIAANTTPCGEALARILTGLALNAITLNFWGLNYLLPAIGMLLILVGFRVLRGENRWFRACWILSVVRTAYHFATLVLNSTIYHKAFYESALGHGLNYVFLALLFALLLCFRKGLRQVQEKAGLPPDGIVITVVIVWYAIVCVLGLLNQGSTFFSIALLVGYICIIRALYKDFRELEATGYTIRPAELKCPNWTLVCILLATVLVGGACGYLFLDSYPMDWQIAEESHSDEAAEVKAHLVSLGFPEAILEDLSEADILECKGALDVVVDVLDHPVNNGREVVTVDGDHIYIDTVYDVKELRITGIAVKLPGEREQWKIIHHFLWTVDPGFTGTECIQLWPAYSTNQGWGAAGEVTGQVLYDRNGTVYQAPFHDLSAGYYNSYNMFTGKYTDPMILATFSLPRKGTAHRGYVAYTVKEVQDGWILNSCINYNHQNSWLQYPVMTAQENRMSESWDLDNRFRLVQDWLQFYPNDEDPEPPSE